MTHQEPSFTASEIRAVFRRTSPEHHPVLRRHTRDEVYDGGRWMAPGGLLLANHMVDHLAPTPGSTILDLACGRGQSSVFLAKGYGASVVSVDYWIVVDGDVLWEDDVLSRGDRAGWSDDYLARSQWLIRHILHGRSHQPSLTHMLLAATRRHDAAVSLSTDSPVHTR